MAKFKRQLAFGLYGTPSPMHPGVLRQWWQEMEAWADSMGIAPNEIAATFRTKPKGMITEHGYKLWRYRSRFERELAADNIEHLSLTTLEQGWEYKALDWEFEAAYGRLDVPEGVFSAGINLERLDDSTNNISASAFAHEAIRRSRSYIDGEYGLALSMPCDFMPGGYVLGLSTSDLSSNAAEMSLDANAWSRYSGGRPWCTDYDRTLRNVYGYNLLNAQHLGILVGDQKLKDWIKGADWRGHIEDLGQGVFLWTFQQGKDEEEFLRWDYPPVVRVRETLKEYDIFPWQRLLAM